MQNARLLLELPCGCKTALYEGDVIGIPFQKLPQAVADVLTQLDMRKYHCPAIQH